MGKNISAKMIEEMLIRLHFHIYLAAKETDNFKKGIPYKFTNTMGSDAIRYISEHAGYTPDKVVKRLNLLYPNFIIDI